MHRFLSHPRQLRFLCRLHLLLQHTSPSRCLCCRSYALPRVLRDTASHSGPDSAGGPVAASCCQIAVSWVEPDTGFARDTAYLSAADSVGGPVAAAWWQI